ncbi:hypothetical protein FB567DRAFT_541033 [Paraphoma chrysanthemicola]|uniref:Tandem CCCH zinc finger domain-containing protein n=1 Tax=Paraphoma chrysanthemicola TaxID=798071 RepID=A0A8K0QS00_9PLEO|nr:hypothetical protein FB567DRAFT_541033 [Paraphoma chrysanthemicola]
MRDRGTNKDEMSHLLRTCIKQSVPRSILDFNIDDCRLVVRIFVHPDVKTLLDPNPMAQFADDFLNDDPHWTVVVGQDPPITTNSVRDQIEDFVTASLQDTNCKHILIASGASTKNYALDSRVTRVAILPGYVPVNASGERIDIHPVTKPDQTCFNEYDLHRLRHDERSPCSNFHIGDGCDEKECEYDHSRLSEKARNAVRFFCYKKPCADGSSCRRVGCFFGHGCLRTTCDRNKCKYAPEQHGLSRELHHWELGRLRYWKMM